MQLSTILFTLFALVLFVSADDNEIVFRGLPTETKDSAVTWTAGQKVSFYAQWANPKKSDDLTKFNMYVKGDKYYSGKAKAENVTYTQPDFEGVFQVQLSLAEDLNGKYVFIWKKRLFAKYWTRDFPVLSINATKA